MHRKLGLQRTTVAWQTGLAPEVVQRAERPDADNRIEDLERIGFILGLDELSLGFQGLMQGDEDLAVRLKTLTPEATNP